MSTSLRVLMVQRFDLRNVACARRIIAMARELLRSGCEVTLIDFPHRARRKELPSLRTLDELADAKIIELPRGGFSILSNIGRVVSLAKNSDVIHLWKCYPDAALPALWAAYFCDKPIHYDWDDWEEGVAGEMTSSSPVRCLARTWEKKILSYVDTVSTASASLKVKALQLGVPEVKVFDAPVGADLRTDLASKRSFDAKAPRLIYVGQLEVAAYAEQAIEALALVSRSLPDATLTIVGGGRFLANLERLAEEKNLGERVVFTGYQPAEEVSRLMALAHVGLAPFEDTETTRAKSPLKVVEYLASGLPVVGSDVGEVPRMVGNAGLVAPPGNVEEFAKAILRVLESPWIWHEFSDAACARVRDFYNWPKTTEALLAAYQCALAT